MPFVRKKNKTFKWPVIVREPSENDAGVFEESEFIAIFKRLKVSEYQKAVDNKTEFEMLNDVSWLGEYERRKWRRHSI
mgnify:CR=1 FL=1